MQQPAAQQRNKLHNPADHRGHKYTDSGVGMAGSEPVQPSMHDEPNWHGPGEAVGGGTYVRDYHQHTAPLESTRTELGTATPTQAAENNAPFRNDMGVDSAASTMTGMGVAESQDPEGSEPASRNPQIPGDSTPYWGNLPKGADGGVYNSVTGHGSATDDHQEHHHLPPKSASPERRRSVIAGHVANYPRGGVYNTVTGHGSRDEESRRHSQPRGSGDGSNMTAFAEPVDDTMFAAPLPDIPEERQKTSHQAAFADTPAVAPGFLPETAVHDDVMLAEAASGNAGQTSFPEKPGAAPPRAFPLATGPVESRNDRRESASPSRHGAAAGVAGLGAAGAGAAASEYAGKRQRGSTPADQNRRNSRSPSLDNRHPIAGGVVTGKRRPSQQMSPVEKSWSHEEESPKGEKKHKILGIFHRHKDDGKEDTRRKSSGDHGESAKQDIAAVNSPNRLRKLSKGESATERRRSPSAANADAEEQSGHSKEKAAAGAAAGAGVFGLLHHRKKNSVSETPQDTTSPARDPMSANAGGAGPAGETPHQVEQVSTPFEHPREPPMPPQGHDGLHDIGSGGQPGHYNVLASGTSSGVSRGSQPATQGTTTNEPGSYNTLASGTPSGVHAAAAPRATRRDVVSSQPGDYNVLKSSGTSPSAKAQQGNSGIVTQEPGNYNTLASGIPSGIRQESSTSGPGAGERNATATHSWDNEIPTEYNILPSGTQSGVKVKPKSPHHNGHATDSTTSRAQDLKDFPAPNTAATGGPTEQQPAFLAGGIPSHVRHERSHPNASQESVPGITTYPHPEMVHNMSPETMPNAYTASAPRHSQGQSGAYQQQGMNPEVMPTAYTTTSSAAAPHPSQLQGQQSQGHGYTEQQYPHQQHTAMGMSPQVLPGTYTASAPRQQQQQQQFGQQQGTNQRQQGTTMQQDMSPAVIPAAYAASAPQAFQGQSQGLGQSQGQQPLSHHTQPQVQGLQQQDQYQSPPQQQQQNNRSTGAHNNANPNPALAAATTSWAASAGKSSGVGDRGAQGMGQGMMGQGKTVHRCQHCGGENDISGYLERFAQEMGMGGRT
ncbi:hypothetical protein C8A01DRAFT_17871 [Parachaetomium inaequale]|uniref:Uncharacterized protein n=1 Tax=Parachaetomium inaequale TaxID=2588326 RepID=A0AAN6PFF1_9PEZI|nr:hypothetical protein C8A01DRAFT_17871 [Parachaetomium inaequale]